MLDFFNFSSNFMHFEEKSRILSFKEYMVFLMSLKPVLLSLSAYPIRDAADIQGQKTVWSDG